MKTSRRTFLFGSISILLLVVVLELMARTALALLGYPFWQPSKMFYPEVEVIKKQEISPTDGYFDILLLGGSAISMDFGFHINKSLDSLLNPKGTAPKVRLHNAAIPAHTSLDNLLKYQKLAEKRFDLVVFYEAINENRANNIPPQYFREDYQHIVWYNDLALIEKHPEVNWTVLPFVVHKSIKLITDKINGEKNVAFKHINPTYIMYGGEIKTAKPYRNNIEQLIKETKARHENLLLVTYALYVPPSVRGNGGYTDYRDFAGCQFPSPLHLWGDPVNVEKGVKQHNQTLRQLATQYEVPLMDMDSLFPRRKEFYCDLCHLTEEGSREYAHKLYEFMEQNHLLTFPSEESSVR
ncbi:MAG: hypothetical protein ACK4GN_07910 [Runella sp.]